MGLGTWLRFGMLVMFFCTCDGGRAAGLAATPTGRQPSSPGTPLPVCVADSGCEPSSACVFHNAQQGHCVPQGTPGGRCRVVGEACDAGLLCAGKGQTCVPQVGAGASCAAAACTPPAICAQSGGADAVCAPPGGPGGVCRATTPACDGGYGCITGGNTCAPLEKDGTCFNGKTFFGCPDGRQCGRWPGDASMSASRCGVPGAVGGPCGDPALGRPVCSQGALCAGGVCRTDTIAPGGACLEVPGHAPCSDDSTCLRGVCVSLGTETAPCRTQAATACDPGLACRDNVCRRTIATGQPCDASPGVLITCQPGDSCVPEASGLLCLRDGDEGGRCHRPAFVCDAGLVCGQARDNGSACRLGVPVGTPCSLAREPFEPCVAGASCSLATRTCVARGEIGAACGDNGACGNGLWCAFDGSARRCYPAPASVEAGSACDLNPDEFRRTNRCAPGLECLAGLCTPAGAAGALCRAVGALPRCDQGLACTGGRCAIGAPVGAACLPGGAGDCAAPALCVQKQGANVSEGVCQAVLGYAMAQTTAESNVVDACRSGEALVFQSLRDGTVPARDDGSVPLKLPFAFPYWGQTFDEVWVGVDGVLGFPPPGSFLDPGRGGNGALPAASQPALIAPLWQDLVLGPPAVSQVCAETQTGAGGRRFVLTWRNVHRYGQPQVSLTFSAVLHETTGLIEFVYTDLFAPVGLEGFASGVRAAIGLQAPGGQASVVHAAPVAANARWVFTPR